MHAESTFKIDQWDQTPIGDPQAGRATVKKTFNGDLEGTSTAELVLWKAPDGTAAYVALEWIDARLANRAGTFVLMHAATADANRQRGNWEIVSGSGTGELRGIHGRGEYRHDAEGAHFTLDCEID